MEGLEEAIEEPRPPMLTERGNDDCNDSPLSWECPGVRGAGMHAHVHMCLHLHAALPESHSTYRPACVRKIVNGCVRAYHQIRRMGQVHQRQLQQTKFARRGVMADLVLFLPPSLARWCVCTCMHACMNAGEEGRSLTQLLSLSLACSLSLRNFGPTALRVHTEEHASIS